MVMFEQQRRLSEPLRWGRRERAVIAALVAAVVLALIGLGAYALTSGSPARADCIGVSYASTLGGAELKGCGERARSICASGSFPDLAHDLGAACAKAGFAYRRTP
jgi:hypothetical protein